MADILHQIDEVLARNAARFDPFGEAWDANRVQQLGDGMRWAGTADVEEEPEQVEAPTLGEQAFREAFAEIAAERRAPVVDVRQPTSDFARDVAAFRRDWVMFGSRYQPVNAGEAVASAPPVDEPEEPTPPLWPAVERDSFGELAYVLDRQPNGEPCEGCRIAPCEDGRCACLAPSPPVIGVTTPGDPWSDIVDTYQRIMDDQGTRRAFFMPAVDAEAERLEMEIRMRINGLTPLLRDLPPGWVSITDDGIGRFHDDPAAPPVDAAPEPDPGLDVQEVDGPCCTPMDAQHTQPNGHSVFCVIEPCGICSGYGCPDCCDVDDIATPQARPWWRRMFPGGTR